MSATRQTPRPFLVGEVLFDHLPDGRAVLGGAPLNVAWHLQALGARPLLLTAVGDDRDGQRVFEAMADWGLESRGVQVARGWPTGHVRVRLEGTSTRFEIPPDQAWDHLSPERLPRWGDDAPALLYHGTLFLRGPGNLGLLERLRRKTGLPVFLDVNLRAPWWSSALLEETLQGVRWLKLNADELEVVAPETAGQTPGRRAAALRERAGAEAVFLTLGAAGAVLSTAVETLASSAPDVEVVDTVGAGDAFSAAVILGLLEGWDSARILHRGLRLAAAVCRIPGAIPSDPKFYRRIAREWG